jgi:DNA-directed RNA polymerase subunit RPC12/RpoP
MPKTGQTPGEGVYECINCGEYIELEYSDDELPACPFCNGKKFEKIEYDEE